MEMRGMTLLFITIFLAVNSCKKKEDVGIQDNSIAWTVHSPVSNATLNIPDKVWIDAEVKANDLIESVRIQLRNKENVKVADELVLKPLSNSFVINQFFNLEDESIPTGEYYFSLNAFTQTGNKEVFVQLFINEANLKLNGLFYISADAGLYQISTDSLFKLADLSNQAHHSYVYSAEGRAVFLDSLSQRISGWLLPQLNDNWEKDFNDFGAKPRLQVNFFNGSELLFPDEEARIHGINSNGQPVFSTDPKPGFAIKGLIKTEQHVVYLEENRLNGEQRLKTAFYPSGQGIHELLLKRKASFVFRYGEKDATLVENHKDGSTLRKFLVEEQDFEFQEIDLPAKVSNAIQPSETVLFVIAGSSIYRVDLNSNSKVILGQRHSAFSHLVYEKVSGTVWEISGNEVYRFDAFEPNQKPSAERYPHRINNFLFLYNR